MGGTPPPFAENSAKIINLIFEPFPNPLTEIQKSDLYSEVALAKNTHRRFEFVKSEKSEQDLMGRQNGL